MITYMNDIRCSSRPTFVKEYVAREKAARVDGLPSVKQIMVSVKPGEYWPLMQLITNILAGHPTFANFTGDCPASGIQTSVEVFLNGQPLHRLGTILLPSEDRCDDPVKYEWTDSGKYMMADPTWSEAALLLKWLGEVIKTTNIVYWTGGWSAVPDTRLPCEDEEQAAQEAHRVRNYFTIPLLRDMLWDAQDATTSSRIEFMFVYPAFSSQNPASSPSATRFPGPVWHSPYLSQGANIPLVQNTLTYYYTESSVSIDQITRGGITVLKYTFHFNNGQPPLVGRREPE